MLLRSFSLMGLTSDADFMLWRIGYGLDAFETMQDALMKTGLGKSTLLTELTVTEVNDGEQRET